MRRFTVDLRKLLIHAAWTGAIHTFLLVAFSFAQIAPASDGDARPAWKNVIGAEAAWDVGDDVIRTTGSPKCVLRTDVQYENYILEFHYRAASGPEGAALIVHSDALPAPGVPWPKGIEIRLDENRRIPSISAIARAKVEPVVQTEIQDAVTDNASSSDGRWHHARIESRDGHLALKIDGALMSTANYSSPRKGYIALKSDGSEVVFRRIRIEELPSTNPAPYEVAAADQGFVSMYNGLDLSDDWEVRPGHRGHWRARDWVIDYDGRSQERDKSLWSKKEYADFVMIADVRLTREPRPEKLPVVLPSGLEAKDEEGNTIEVEIPYAGDTGIYVRGSSKNQVNIGNRYIGSGGIYGYRADESMPADVRRAVTPRVKANNPPGEWDRYVITMDGDRLGVELNGVMIIDGAQLPGVDDRGKIALQDDHADNNTFQFANLYIRELK